MAVAVSFKTLPDLMWFYQHPHRPPMFYSLNSYCTYLCKKMAKMGFPLKKDDPAEVKLAIPGHFLFLL